MSVMSQPIEEVETIVPLSDPPPQASDEPSAALRLLKAPLRLIAGLLLAPLLLGAAAVSFPFVVADFAVFRLRDLRAGHPAPKGLWEF